ncbi:Tetratricopeptide TPR_2 repeat protein [Candidatus Desulforudis audaxviator MP104C]|uniref:Tetratricopeptide TPR_2 repeat protein n=1 Tax=Desulforudis audaxviator (strain MP104C) TaxID=477974 RepID=B1I2L5_DESAP|nr:tetratricopeptide repeat protein [Candidatus Desulforudis audaxviator]ACA59255.1 Tetratricopeptide TPR_2 repeat protein [Candidatus Desulforudis audaxviator MP104C]
MLAAGCGNAAKAREAVARGDAAMEKGDFDAAARAYEEALRLDLDNAAARTGAEKAKKAGNLDGYLKSVVPIIDETEKLARQWDELRQ